MLRKYVIRLAFFYSFINVFLFLEAVNCFQKRHCEECNDVAIPGLEKQLCYSGIATPPASARNDVNS